MRRFCNEKKHVSIGPISIYAPNADKVNVIMFRLPSTRQRRPFAPVKYSADHPFKTPCRRFFRHPHAINHAHAHAEHRLPPSRHAPRCTESSLKGRRRCAAIPIHPSPRTPAVFPLPPPHSCPSDRMPHPCTVAPPSIPAPWHRTGIPQAAPPPNDAATAHHSPRAIENTAKIVNSPLNPNANCHPPHAANCTIIRRQHQPPPILARFLALCPPLICQPQRKTWFTTAAARFTATQTTPIRHAVKSRRKTTVKNSG